MFMLGKPAFSQHIGRDWLDCLVPLGISNLSGDTRSEPYHALHISHIQKACSNHVEQELRIAAEFG